MDFKFGKMDMEFNWKFVPPIVAVVMILIGVLGFSSTPGVMGNIILLAIMAGTLPYIIVSYLEYQRIKAIEEEFPDFLLDLSEAQKVGLSLPEALRQVAKTDYGKLSGEIKKLNYQISWGVPVQEALDRFGKRLSKSQLIVRVVRIINEAYSSGGDLSRTMESTASDIALLKEADKEKSAMTYQQVIIMYAIYFIFIGIIIGISKTLLPLLQLNVETSSAFGGGLFAFQDPCTICQSTVSLACTPCTLYSTMCSMFNLGSQVACSYNALFLLMIVIQGIFSGLVAGQIGENSPIAGLKHSAIMTLSGFAIMMFLFQIGFL